MNNVISKYFQDKNTQKTKTKKTYRTFVVMNDKSLAEQITNPDPQFAVFNPLTESVQIKSALEVDGKYIYPLDGDLVTKRVILFPEKAEDYQNIEALRQEIIGFIHKYVDIEPFYEALASYYILLTWLFDRNTVINYLGIFGDYGSGKTRAAQIIGSVCYKPALVSGALTCAPIYRILEEARGTLMINEFDFDHSDMGIEMIKILNNGYEQGMHVLRSEKNTLKTQAFDAFGPKIFTYRKKKRDEAFESRLITIPIQETKREDIPVILPFEHKREAQSLRNKLLMFRFRNYYKDIVVDQSIFQGVERRLRQTLYPLLTVVDDPSFITELKDFIQNLQQEQRADRGMSWVAEYLIALINLTFMDSPITVKALADKYNEGKIERDQVNARKAGSAIRNDLKLKTKRITSGENKGQYEIVLDKENIKALCLRYGIEIPEQSSLYSPCSPQDQAQSEHSERSEGSRTTPCYNCGGLRFWKSNQGPLLCVTCHPPVENQNIEYVNLEDQNKPKTA